VSPYGGFEDELLLARFGAERDECSPGAELDLDDEPEEPDEAAEPDDADAEDGPSACE
jgi:hypothetical protein